MENRIKTLFGIRYPVIQGGMVWCAGWELAAAVSEAGGLGLIGSGSMTSDELRRQIRACRRATQKPFGVNLPLMNAKAESHLDVILQEKVGIVFTSAGDPSRYTSRLKAENVRVCHVVSSSRFAMKALQAGVDAVVAEGFEAGGHNGREETTTMVLVPAVCRAVNIPVIAAGGIATGRQMLAAFALGAEGVQMGTRFVASREASCHENFKKKVLELGEGDTMLALKSLQPVRLVKNEFFEEIHWAETHGVKPRELKRLLGRGRSRKGMFEGDTVQGELEIGEVSALVDEIKGAGEIVREIIREFEKELNRMKSLHL